MSFKYRATLRATKIVSMVDCELDLNAVLSDNSAGGGPALLFVNVFYHQLFVTGVTKTSKAGLPLFLSGRGYLGISKSETDPPCTGTLNIGLSVKVQTSSWGLFRQ